MELKFIYIVYIKILLFIAKLLLTTIKNWEKTGDCACERGICARYDENGKLTTSKIGLFPGEVCINASNTNVWFLEENEEEAKRILIEEYKLRVDTLQKHIDKYHHVLEILSR